MTINVEFFRGKGGHASDASSPRSLPVFVHFWTVKTMPQCFFGPFVIERKILRNLGQNLDRTNISIVNKVSREKGVVDTINCIRLGVSPSSKFLSKSTIVGSLSLTVWQARLFH